MLRNYQGYYEDWLAAIQQENLGNFGTGAFNQLEWNIHIQNFARLPDNAYNSLINFNFIPTRMPTIIFLLFNP